MLVILFVLFSLLGEMTGAKETCHVKAFETCKLNMIVIQMSPFSKEKHEKYCDNVLQYFTCVDQHRKDFALDKLCGFPLILGRAEKFLTKKFCKKTPFQKRFLKHASCYDTVRDFYYECQRFANEQIELYHENFPSVKDQYEAPKRCMLASLKAVCMARQVKKICGNEAEKTFVHTLNGLQVLAYYCKESDYHTSYMRTELVMKVTKGDLP